MRYAGLSKGVVLIATEERLRDCCAFEDEFSAEKCRKWKGFDVLGCQLMDVWPLFHC